MKKNSANISKYKNFFIDVMSLAGGQMLIALVALANSALLARALGVEDRGYFVMAMLLPNIFVTFTDFGLGAAGTRYTASKKWLSSVIFFSHTVIIFFRIIFIGILSFLVINFYGETFFPGIPKEYLYLGMMQSIALVIQGLIFPILLGMGKGIKFSIILFLSSLLSFSFLAFGWLIFGLTVKLALILQITSSILVSVFIYINVFLDIDDQRKFSIKYIKDAFSYGIGVFISIISTFVNEKMILLIINFYGGVIYVSLYTIAQALTERIYLLSDAVGTMLMPKIAEDEKNNSQNLTPLVFKLSVIFTFIISLFLIFLSEKIIIFIYTDEFFDSAEIMKILLVAVVFSSGWKVLLEDLNGRGFTGQTALVNLIITFVCIILSIILLPMIGLVGAAIASTIAYFIGLIIGIIIFIGKTENANMLKLISFSSVEKSMLKGIFKYLKSFG